MRHRTLELLGIALPTAMAAIFETGVLFTSTHPSMTEALGRVLLLALGATVFTYFMARLVDQQQRHLQHQQGKFDAVFLNSPEGVLLVNQQKLITAMNPRASSLLGYAEPMGSFPLCRICAPPIGSSCPVDCPFDPAKPRPYFQSNMRHRNGQIFAVAAGISILSAADQGETESVIRFSDISTLRAQEEAELSKLLARKILEAQEGERKLLARELHDGLGQSLYALRLAARNGLPVEEMTLSLMEEVSRMAKALWPTALDKLGLCSALESTLKNLDNVTLHIPKGFPRLSQELEIPLYRIAQEAVTNALKHGAASAVNVNLETTGSDVMLTIQDNGSGFDLNDSQKRLGLGLASRERAELALGICEIQSQPGMGTLVQVRLPLGDN